VAGFNIITATQVNSGESPEEAYWEKGANQLAEVVHSFFSGGNLRRTVRGVGGSTDARR
jgi:hypothetical protein